ncbi:MAG: Hpt domain-containing protein, partial [Pseudomonadota bacterium]
MDKKKEEFLARLRETFRVEASDHLEAITAGLMAIERANEAEQASIIERIFREAHSLKGAARSVSLAGVEALCAELETLFSALKRRELALSAALLDGVHPALDVIAALCANPGAASSPEAHEREKRALAVLRQMTQ